VAQAQMTERPLGPERLAERAHDRGADLFLQEQAVGESVDQAGERADADEASAGYVSDRREAVGGHQVVRAHQRGLAVAQHDERGRAPGRQRRRLGPHELDRVDAIPVEDLIGPRVGHASPRARERGLGRGVAPERPQEVVDGAGGRRAVNALGGHGLRRGAWWLRPASIGSRPPSARERLDGAPLRSSGPSPKGAG
jgi:hypothetical protein